MDDTTLFRVVLHLLVVFTEQLFAALVSSGGNSRLAVATLDDGDLIVWTGHLVFLLSDFRYKKSRRPFFRFPAWCAAGGGGYLVKIQDYLTL